MKYVRFTTQSLSDIHNAPVFINSGHSHCCLKTEVNVLGRDEDELQEEDKHKDIKVCPYATQRIKFRII